MASISSFVQNKSLKISSPINSCFYFIYSVVDLNDASSSDITSSSVLAEGTLNDTEHPDAPRTLWEEIGESRASAISGEDNGDDRMIDCKFLLFLN